MRFNSAANWYTGTDTPLAHQFDLWSVATHEMGHCLGLDHEDNVDPLPVMRTTLSVETVVRQLTADDVAGRNSIYNAPRAAPPAAPASPGDGGGEGGCSLFAAHAPDAASPWTVLGNLGLPVMVLAIMRVWRHWRRR